MHIIINEDTIIILIKVMIINKINPKIIALGSPIPKSGFILIISLNIPTKKDKNVIFKNLEIVKDCFGSTSFFIIYPLFTLASTAPNTFATPALLINISPPKALCVVVEVSSFKSPVI
jgi:hypothetical protein